jgi:hypothetical protein
MRALVLAALLACWAPAWGGHGGEEARRSSGLLAFMRRSSSQMELQARQTQVAQAVEVALAAANKNVASAQQEQPPLRKK